MILSASRRTDIPCFYSEWFLNRLRSGYVITVNPMNLSQVRKISLSPDELDCIVFWTKDPLNMMDKLPVLDELGYRYYFQFTLNPYGKEVERYLRDKEDIVDSFIRLSRQIGIDRVMWRYDPIILNEIYTVDYHLHSFVKMCRQLEGYTRVCTISFVDDYRKLSRSTREMIIREISEEKQHYLAANLAQIANSYGIELRACCEGVDYTADGVGSAACIDKELIEHICGRQLKLKRDKNQRTGCGCAESVDIGVYNSCPNGCIYCYANYSEASIRANHYKHNPESDILI